MAATAKKKTATKKAPKQSAKTRETKQVKQAKKQMWAVVLFALGLLIGALTLLKGERLWLWIHNSLLGLFGWSVYFLAPLMIYIAVIAAMDRPLSAIKAKLWQMFALILIISGAIQIFGSGLPDEGSFVNNLVALFESGVSQQGGGVLSAICAYPLISLTGALGAKIIIVLAIFVFAMLITGSSLLTLYERIRRPVVSMEEAYADSARQSEERKAREKEEPKPKKSRKANRFDIDVDISADSEPAEEPGPFDRQEPERELLPDPFAFTKDKPTEYIDPEPFGGSQETESPFEPSAKRPHPLDEEILQGADSTQSGAFGGGQDEDSLGINEILSQFASGAEAPTETDQEPLFASFFGEEPAEEGPHETAGPDKPSDPFGAPKETAQEAFAPPPPPPVYIHPSLELLQRPKAPATGDVTEELKNNAQTLVDTLKSFGVQTRITDICRGPAVTRYELQPSAGVKISKITSLSDDIALNLASAGIRIEAPIPNKAAIGIEVPNKTISVVSIREIIDSPDFADADSKLTVALGKDIAGNIVTADLGKMPHVLIAGATGSGKSVCINSIILSLLYKSSPEQVKLLMVDPKVVELGIYNGIPHLLVPVVTDPKKAAGALNWAVTEMLKRYKTFADNAVRDIAGYNSIAAHSEELESMPQIVIIIDELADLMMAAPGDVEDAICRLAQMARAAGMHLVIATQRPSVDVITGVIKANIPSRVAFAVSSQVDSRTILDMGGAEKLLGRGDMLFYPVGAAKPLRVQGCFVNDHEVEKVVDFVKRGDPHSYDEEIAEEIARHVVPEKGKKGARDEGGGFSDEDELLPQAIECVVEMGQASTSALQRRLKLGYARAARIIDQLEQKGIVGPFEGSKPRQVLISKDRWMEMKLSGAEEEQLSMASTGPEPLADPPPFDL